MKFKQWLRKSYKKDDGKKLSLLTVLSYDREYKKLNKFVYTEFKKNISDMSVADAKDLLNRLLADTVFQQRNNAQTQYRVLELYIMFRERNI